MSGSRQLVKTKGDARFPKTSRLLKSREFKFKNYKKIRLPYFLILVEENGKGRIGVSIAKRVLKRSVWRNRVRRLIKEAFRTEQAQLKTKDIHVIAQAGLINNWDKLKLAEVKDILKKAVQ